MIGADAEKLIRGKVGGRICGCGICGIDGTFNVVN
jgi:hypothetical protein